MNTQNKSNTMSTMLKLIQEKLFSDKVQISIRQIPNSNNVEITTIENLPAGISEHVIVRSRPNCIIRNTYRNGRKTGMQIHSREEFEYPGDLADHPLKKRPSTTSDSPHDSSR